MSSKKVLAKLETLDSNGVASLLCALKPRLYLPLPQVLSSSNEPNFSTSCNCTHFVVTCTIANMATTSTHTESILEHLFNHFALPVRLPGRQDSMSVKLQCAILDRAIYASRELARLTAGRMHNPWERVRLLLQTCKSANDDGRLSKASLLSAFRQLQDKDTDLLILHVTAQNAGLLMRRYYQ